MNTDRPQVTMAQIAESDRIVRQADVALGVKVKVKVRVHEGRFSWTAQVVETLYAGRAWKWRRDARGLAVSRACKAMERGERRRKVEPRVVDLPR